MIFKVVKIKEISLQIYISWIMNHDLNCQKDHNRIDERMIVEYLKKIALLVNCNYKQKPIKIKKYIY